MTVKIIICGHKEAELPNHPYFLPIQAGASLHAPINGFTPDNSGDNISDRNPHWCELTAHYWAWNNLTGVDIIGLCHYRRFFNFTSIHPSFCADRKFVKIEDFFSKGYTFPNLEKLLNNYDVILPPKRHWRVSNTQQYADYHISNDWEMLRKIISEKSPEYIPAFEKTMDNSNSFSGYNMFITKWDTFNNYSNWLFKILFEVEKRVPPIDDPVQSRIYGYMSERLINVFCHHHNLRIKHIPLIMPLDDTVSKCNINPFHHALRNITNDLIFKIKG